MTSGFPDGALGNFALSGMEGTVIESSSTALVPIALVRAKTLVEPNGLPAYLDDQDIFYLLRDVDRLVGDVENDVIFSDSDSSNTRNVCQLVTMGISYVCHVVQLAV